MINHVRPSIRIRRRLTAHRDAPCGLASLWRATLIVAASVLIASESGGASTSANGTRFIAVPAEIVAACRAAQETAGFEILCPARLPRSYLGDVPGGKPSPLSATAFAGTVDIGYSAEADTTGARLSLNEPARFFHLVIGPADQGIPPGARRAKLGGRVGLLTPAVPGRSVGQYFQNHVRFIFSWRGHSYVVSLHTFGETATEKLLGEVVRGLKPLSEIQSFRVTTPVSRRVRLPDGPIWVANAGGALWAVSAGAVHSSQPLTSYLTRIFNAGQPAIVRDVGTRAMVATTDGRSIWVASTRNAPDGNFAAPELAKLDATTRRVTSRVSMSKSRDVPIAGAVASNGTVWFALQSADNASAGTVVAFDGRSMTKLGNLSLQASPTAVAATRAGHVWVTTVDGTANEIDVRTRKVIDVVRGIGDAPTAAVAEGDGMWIAADGGRLLRRIYPGNRQPTVTTRLQSPTYALTTGAKTLWAALPGRGVVDCIDRQTGALVGSFATGGDPIGIFASGDSLWALMSSDGLMIRLVSHALPRLCRPSP